VVVNGHHVGKPGQAVGTDAELAVQRTEPEYVSRGAYKLLAALDQWAIEPTGKAALDVGASTGGFTDVLLERGAGRVYAVDVGYGQLHYRLRNDPRVVSMERTNVRYLESLPEPIELAVADVSFISLRLALPPVFRLLEPEAPLIALVKPQFEAGRAQVGRRGVVRDPAVHQQVLDELEAWSANQPWHLRDVLVSPIKGPAGNVEFLTLWRG
jgi:23S rRNA (cytidine1920-2'-O)/16S rRNA (cytidine1409-2'-O)-methyltransferase